MGFFSSPLFFSHVIAVVYSRKPLVSAVTDRKGGVFTGAIKTSE